MRTLPFSIMKSVLLGLLLTLGASVVQAEVQLSQGQVGNVDAGQFQVYWQTDGSGRPGLDIFADAEATVSLNGELGVEFYPLDMHDITVGSSVEQREARRALQDLTRSKGIVLARVTGAEPGQTYHVRPRSYDVVTGDPNEVEPASLIEVTTAQDTAFIVESRQLRVTVGGCFAGSQGLVMRLTRTGSPYPLFAVVGDHELDDQALFDLGRLLNSDGTTNEILSGTPSLLLELLDPAAPAAVSPAEVAFTGADVVAEVAETLFAAGFPGLAYFSLEAVGIPLQGQPFTFHISARDANGEILTTYTGNVELAASVPENLASGAGMTPNFVDGRLLNHQVVVTEPGLLTFTVSRPCGIETGSASFFFSSPDLDFSFDAPVYTVAQEETSVTLTITRAATVPAAVLFSLQDGTAHAGNPPFAAALANVDYTPPVGGSTVIEFEEGETSKTVEVPLLGGAATMPNKRFTAHLQAPAEGATLAGLHTTASIQILASDNVAPKLTLLTPAASKKPISQGLPLLVTGKAEDARGIERVEVRLNGGDPVLAELGDDLRPPAVPFSLEVVPLEGANTLEVTALDLRGNRTTVERSFVFQRRSWLTLTRVVPATTPADTAGQVALKADVAANASALGPKGGVVQQSMVVPGTYLVLTATPKKDHVFSHWEGLPEGAWVQGSVVSFYMPDDDVETLRAVFVSNPFPVYAGGAKSTYQGLLLPADATPASNGTVGWLSSTLTAAKGSLSGKITMDGKVVSFVAMLHGDGSIWFQHGKTGAPALDFLGRQLTMSWDEDGLTLRITGAEGAVSTGLARPPAHSKTSPVAPGLLDAAGRQGYYTIALPAKTQTPVRPLDSYPQGYGYTNLTLQADGTFKMAGLLADGSKITASSYLVAGAQAPFFIQLPTPGASSKDASFLGTFAFAAGEVGTGDLLWFRPEVVESSKPATQLYTTGWPNGLALDAVGALYDKSQVLQAGLGLGAADDDGNALLEFSAGKLLSPVQVMNLNIAASKVIKLPANDRSYTLKLTQASGAMSGTFTPNWDQPAKALPKFQGILINSGPNRGGYGFFLSNATGDTDPESGAVELGAQEE
jgi:hypothetical protein